MQHIIIINNNNSNNDNDNNNINNLCNNGALNATVHSMTLLKTVSHFCFRFVTFCWWRLCILYYVTSRTVPFSSKKMNGCCCTRQYMSKRCERKNKYCLLVHANSLVDRYRFSVPYHVNVFNVKCQRKEALNVERLNSFVWQWHKFWGTAQGCGGL